MKKFAKVVGIMALVLAVAGMILALVGAFGGGVSVLNRLAEEGRLSFGPEDFGLEELGQWNVVYELDEDTLFNENYRIYSGANQRFDTDGETVTGLVIGLSGGEVTIRQGTEEYWQVEVDGMGRFQVYAENGVLYVVGAQSGFRVNVGEVTIYAPAQMNLDTARVDLGAGETEIEYLAAERMELSVGAGTLYVEELVAEDLEVNVGAGEIQIDSGQMGNVEAGVGMGAMDIEAMITGNLKGSVSMGELVVTVRGSGEKDHNYKLSCAAGEMTVGSRVYAGLGNSQEIDNGAETTYKLDCAMGSLKVVFR